MFESRTIQLRNGGHCFICDAEDENYALDHNWRLDRDGYIVRGKRDENGKYHLLRFHREVLKINGIHVPDDSVVDHKNKIKTDNRKQNLRICSQAENIRNRGSLNNGSGYRGVYWNNKNQNWVARIRVDGRSVHIGSFSSPKEAAYYYNMAAQALHGDFAQLNEL